MLAQILLAKGPSPDGTRVATGPGRSSPAVPTNPIAPIPRRFWPILRQPAAPAPCPNPAVLGGIAGRGGTPGFPHRLSFERTVCFAATDAARDKRAGNKSAWIAPQRKKIRRRGHRDAAWLASNAPPPAA